MGSARQKKAAEQLEIQHEARVIRKTQALLNKVLVPASEV